MKSFKYQIFIQRSAKMVFLLFSFMTGAFLTAKAQQPFTYTQYMNNGTPLNAAYSLLDKAGTVNLTGRKQWTGIDGTPETFLFTGAIPIEKLGASAGLVISHDKVTIEKQTSINAFFAKSVQLDRNTFLAASFSAGIRSFKAPYSELDPSDVSFKQNVSETSGTIGLGVMLYNPDRFYIGASLPGLRLNKKDQNGNTVKNTWYFSGAYLFDGGTGVKFKPSVLLTYTPDLKTQEDVSLMFYMMEDQLGLGANYRTTKEVAGIVSYAFKNNLTIGYSYQTGVGDQRVGGLGNSTHEVSLTFRFGRDLQHKLL